MFRNQAAVAAGLLLHFLPLLTLTSADPTNPPDTSLTRLPIAYYGAQWERDDANIEALSRMNIVILMQEEGPCWTTCCPNASTTSSGKCDPSFNATSLPGCNPQCDQHGYQAKIFSKVKAVATAAGRRSPHCMLFANTIYDWPFDLAHAGGDAVDVLDVHGKPHMESCDPGIFPSFFYDYGKEAGRKAYLDIIERAVVNGSADGVYADCYGQYGLTCKGSECTAKRNGKVQSYNDQVTEQQVADYESGKNATLHLIASMVGINGTVFSKLSSSSGPKFGGPYASSLMMVGKQSSPERYLATVAEWRQNYHYLIMGNSNDYSHPSHPDAPTCSTEEVALFLLAVEPGMSLLCNGWSDDYEHALGLPTGPATQDPTGGDWTRHFASGTTATWSNTTGGKVSWGDHPNPPPAPPPPPPPPSPPSPGPAPPVPPQMPMPPGNYLGCYNDKQHHVCDLPHVIDGSCGSQHPKSRYPGGMTPELCNYLCIQAGGFDFFGNQAGHACFCGNSYGSQGAAPASDCNATCNGNKKEVCGGPDRNSVWKTRR